MIDSWYKQKKFLIQPRVFLKHRLSININCTTLYDYITNVYMEAISMYVWNSYETEWRPLRDARDTPQQLSVYRR